MAADDEHDDPASGDGRDQDGLDDDATDGDEADGDEADDDATDDDATGGGGERRVHPAVFASNWRTVLVVDAAMGVAVAVAGLVVAAVWNVIAGGILGSLGVAYVVAVVRRGREWADLRRDAGL